MGRISRNNYMLAYMRGYRKGIRKGKSEFFFHVGRNCLVRLSTGRCPGCSILSPTMCRMCEIEGVVNGQSTKQFQLTALALL